jgi:glucokinase
MAVDCGGTKTTCALHRQIERRATLASRDFPSLAILLTAFLDGQPIADATIAVPGTVDEGCCLC